MKASDCVDSDTNNEAYIQDNEGSSGTDIPAPKRSKLGKFLGKRYTFSQMVVRMVPLEVECQY